MPRGVVLTLAVVAAAGIARPVGPPVLAAQRVPRAAIAQARGEIERLAKEANADVSVIWRPLDGAPDEALVLNPTARYHAASTMKVPVMIELFRQAHEGQLKLDDQVPVINSFRSIVDGSPYELSVSEDSDGDTYKAIGATLSLRTLCETMITVSGNLAADVLVEHLGAKNIQATVEKLGAGGMQVLRGVEDLKAFDQGLNNTTDAAGLATLFEKLARGEVVSADASAEMIAILKRQKHNEGIPAGLPAGLEIAHKTGEVTRVHHDAGVVYAPRPYVVVVLTRGIDDHDASGRLIAEISKKIFGLLSRGSEVRDLPGAPNPSSLRAELRTRH